MDTIMYVRLINDNNDNNMIILNNPAYRGKIHNLYMKV